jgi:tryptophan synthase alpha chain
MKTIKSQLQKIKQRGTIGLMTHVVVGYPSLEQTVCLVKTMAENRVDFIELQIPFSDPLADGPTIMRACEKSLENGTKVKDAFTVMKQCTDQVSIPILFMAYYNTVFNYGVEKFCKDAKEAGASGLIVPDMPLDEEDEEHFYKFAKQYGLNTIQVISPASTESRLKRNAESANGFVYCTAKQGITGAQTHLDPNLSAYLQRIKPYFSVPVAVGFGISKKEHLDQLKLYADIAVVGSAVIDIINNTRTENLPGRVADFLRSLRG